MKHSFIPLLLLFICLPVGKSIAQCPEENHFHKYLQYRERFFKTYMVQDFDTARSCVRDGIGYTANSKAPFSKRGFGLPASTLMISPRGTGIPGRYPPRADGFMADWGCLGDFGDKHNWVGYGSETLSELGLFFITMSTEYELLGRSGQKKAQQKTLEHIFLGLQAVRRLDMQTQLLLKQMYDDRKQREDYVSQEPYTLPKRRFGTWKKRVRSDCSFEPDLSGYTGFFIREDAGQHLKKWVQDDEPWDVDLIGSAFGAIGIDYPCDKYADPFSWLVQAQHFISHDQLINLLSGLAYVKKFIPEDATVTTCDGQQFQPVEMAQKISQAAVSRLTSHRSRIVVPNSDQCVRRKIKLSNSEGGDCRTTIHGLRKVNAFIQGDTIRTHLVQKMLFESMANDFFSPFGRSFYIGLSSTFKNMGQLSKASRKNMRDLATHHGMEIFLLGNDLLFPEGEKMADMVGGKAFFDSLLCMAPCEGPCYAKKEYTEFLGPDAWPKGFYCPNVPGWNGHRWHKPDPKVIFHAVRRPNGLDFMMLYTMYMLQYGEGDFYLPKYLQPNRSLTLYNEIAGPTTLCPTEMGDFEIKGLQRNTYQDLTWSAHNMTLRSGNMPAASGRIPKPSEPATIQIQYSKSKEIIQYHRKPDLTPDGFTQEKCAYYLAKSILPVATKYQLQSTIFPCKNEFVIQIEPIDGDFHEDSQIDWTITRLEEGQSFSVRNQRQVDLAQLYTQSENHTDLLDMEGTYQIGIDIRTGCGSNYTLTDLIEIGRCP